MWKKWKYFVTLGCKVGIALGKFDGCIVGNTEGFEDGENDGGTLPTYYMMGHYTIVIDI